MNKQNRSLTFTALAIGISTFTAYLLYRRSTTAANQAWIKNRLNDPKDFSLLNQNGNPSEPWLYFD